MDVHKNLLEIDNLGLLTNRQVNTEFRHVFCTKTVINDCTMSGETRERTYLFPLYIIVQRDKNDLMLFGNEISQKRANIKKEFITDLSLRLGLSFLSNSSGDLVTQFGPEDIFYYIYSILHNPTYRTRYAEFLKIDFPRVPLTSDKALFAALVKKGKELVDLHLLRSPTVENFITTYPVNGENRVEKVRYEDGKVWINPAQYFGGVPKSVWNFKIGGYQVCDKWLKDRKSRVLSAEDISHYQRVVVALNETIRLMRGIDEAIPKWPIE